MRTFSCNVHPNYGSRSTVDANEKGDDRSESDEVSPQPMRNTGDDERGKAPPRFPQTGRTREYLESYMLEAIFRHRTDEQLERRRRRTDVVVLSCDRFRCDQAIWDKSCNEQKGKRTYCTPRPVPRLRCTKINLQAHVHRILHAYLLGRKGTEDFFKVGCFDYIAAKEQLERFCNGSCSCSSY